MPVIKCKTSDFPSECPAAAKCSQITLMQPSSSSTAAPSSGASTINKVNTIPTDDDDDVVDGECTCTDLNFEFNVNFTNVSNYCIRSTIVHSSVTAAGSTAGTNGGAGGAPITKSIEPPSTWHLTGGFLISICVVFVFVGIVLLAKRVNWHQCLRNLRISGVTGGGGGGVSSVLGGVGNGNGRSSRHGRGRRPFYEDVMMSNDNDDPPLI